MARRISRSKRISWHFEYWGYRVMEGAIRLAPAAAIDGLGSGAGTLLYYLSPKYRRLAIRNLRIALGDQTSTPEIHRLARATCQRTIANFLGTVKTTTLPSTCIKNHAEVEGIAMLHETLSKGSGAIFVLGHMGNWEVLNRLHSLLPPDTQAGGIYQRLKNPHVDAHLLKKREQDGSLLFEKKNGFHAPANFVKKGGLLIIVADQKAGKAGIPIPFFGRLSSLSPLPALLAKKAGAPVFAVGIETTAPGKWKIILKALANQPSTAEIISTLETLIRRSPADYLWLHDRWRITNMFPLSLSSQKHKEQHQTSRPLRVLLLSETPPSEEVLKSYLARRHPQDIPLLFETLIVQEHSAPPATGLPYLESPTIEQLASEVRELDSRNSLPIQLALLLSPEPKWATALSLAKVPETRTKSPALSLDEFLEKLTALPSAP